jgi:hypothetical protein
MTTAFVMGLVASALASTSGVLQRMVATSERAVMLPSLLLAGAYVSWPASTELAAVVAAAFAARVLAKLLAARLLTRGEAYEDVPRISLGLGLLPAGVLTMTVGLACALRFPGPIGDTILALAALNAAAGEVIGPAMLRRTMRVAGEIPDTAAMTPVPAPSRARPQPAKRGSRGSRGSLAGSRGSDAHGHGGPA